MNIGEILYAIVLYPIVQVIEVAYQLFYKLFNNTGIAVMGVSFVVTVLCLPLYIVAERWQQLERDTQARLKSGVDRIKAVFKGDEQYMILSTYYRQNHYHPMMALRSSFGLLIQVPFFMAAYSCLSSLPALQGQSFLFIRDMGAPDALFTIGGFGVNVLPIAMTIINIIAGAIYTKGFPFKEKAQIYGMALLFLVILYNSPAGLVLYWTMNNVFSLVKNIFYKLKHPIKVLYLLMCAGIVLVDMYILFVYKGGASMTKRLSVVLPFTSLLLIPYFIRGVHWLLDTKIKSFVYAPTVQKLKLFIPATLALALLSGLVLPSSLIASSVSEFSDIGAYGNPAVFLCFSLFQSLGLFVFWPLCIFFLFKEKIQSLMTIVFSMGFVCSLLNAFLFMVNYGPMVITLNFGEDLPAVAMGYTLLNAFVLVVVCFLVFILVVKNNRKLFSSIAIIGVLALAVLGILNVSTISSEYSQYKDVQQKNMASVDDMEPVLNFSKTGKNVVVLMLDRASNAYLEHIFKDQSELYEQFEGFTYYKNTVGFGPKTITGAPALYGGYEYMPSEMNRRSELPLKEKHNQALLLMPRILTEEAGFTASMFDSSWANYSRFPDMSFTDHYDKIDGLILRHRYSNFAQKQTNVPMATEQLETGLKRNLLWFSLFRSSPVGLRPIIYYHGTYFNPSDMVNFRDFWGDFSTLLAFPYITDYSSSENSLMIITNEIAHEVFESDDVQPMEFEPLSYPDSMHYKENTMALKLLGKWFQVLKENGVYDNTRIVIVSDHGIGSMGNAISHVDFDVATIDGFPKDYNHSLLLFKDFNSSESLKVDETFMTTADVPSLVLEGIVDNPINPFTGNSVVSDSKKDGVYITFHGDLWKPEHSKSEYIFTVPDTSWYHVKDNIFVDSNWTQEVPR